MGRPTSYKPEYAEQAYRYALLGATDKQMAQFFGMSIRGFDKWKLTYPEFMDALTRGKAEADARVGESLYQRATGYTHPEEKIFVHNGEVIRAETQKHYPPDTTACIFWLKNRKKDVWRDKQDHEVTGADGGPIVHQVERKIVRPDDSNG